MGRQEVEFDIIFCRVMRLLLKAKLYEFYIINSALPPPPPPLQSLKSHWNSMGIKCNRGLTA